MSDLIDRQAARDALWKALFEYEDKTEKQFLESDELDIRDWMLHRIFVQNMNDIDRETILNLPSAEPERKKGKWIIYVISLLDGEDVKCSECGQCGCAPNWNFCPNCGAEMTEVENETD